METATEASLKYQSLFPEVSSISSRELLLDTFSSSNNASDVTDGNPGSAPLTTAAAATIAQPQWKLRGQTVLLVDVRSPPERRVSMISGAISMDEFRNEVLPRMNRSSTTEDDSSSSSSSHVHDDTITTSQHDKLAGSNSPLMEKDPKHSNTSNTNEYYDDEGITASDETRTTSSSHPYTYHHPGIVATYCTIGYRSGMEARKLQHDYPYLFRRLDDDDGDDAGGGTTRNVKTSIRIVNLDGIVPFANAALEFTKQAQIISQGTDDQEYATTSASVTTTSMLSSAPPTTLLVEPTTSRPTKRVHVYGASWKHYLSDRYDARVFSKFDFAW
eukprot:CAMPEP_0183717994 /NCGR_PEP_ID=MMETSP0737-20130205/11381_1 /TAXON_ID=385413 /ORGANISM="Thalassiosira miniscula, Strain CCMP1093" /LENGTH=329 /DNA_ID=CAMNT_0025947473 /DNA_START=93 /DNA_END=1079 /DNA_ORIENTATION=-